MEWVWKLTPTWIVSDRANRIANDKVQVGVSDMGHSHISFILLRYLVKIQSF
jgi:hypothetical protein